ncbi:MAG: hypothetical protein M1822_001601 [Bathelium mastoideum]|nr:MAG: hypothetical protein M1822_001601 [Bathelium mastoideum]
MQASHDSLLTRLVSRLEAATSRLEDIASSATSFEAPPSTTPNGSFSASSTAKVSGPSPQATTPTPPKASSLPPAVEEFETIINGDVKPYLNLSQELGGPIAEQASSVSRAFAAQRRVLIISTQAKKPEVSSSLYMEILKELQQEMQRVTEAREASRDPKLKDHISMVADGIGALSWVAIDPKPADFVVEVLGGAQFYGNRVLKEYKEKDQTQVRWVQAYYKIWRSLISYIKAHYVTGLTWNKDGIDPTQALENSRSDQPTTNGTSNSLPPSGAGAPPPPPPPLPSFDNAPPSSFQQAVSTSSNADMGAVFDQLNRGEDVTKGLRKVDRSEMTHKNPSLRANAPGPVRSDSSSSTGRKSPNPPKKPKPEAMRQKKPPKKELDGNKWLIENFENEQRPIEIEAQIQHSILITKCKNTTLRINGKFNAVSIDNSPGLSIIVDSVVSSVDVIRCGKFALQVLGSLPTILLDQVDGATVYLSPESLNTEILTSKCTAVNINIPPQADEDDYRECPLAEQIRSYIQNGKVVSEVVEHAG